MFVLQFDEDGQSRRNAKQQLKIALCKEVVDHLWFPSIGHCDCVYGDKILSYFV